MLYVCMNEVGYETHLADSDDLLKWNPLGKVLSFRETMAGTSGKRRRDFAGRSQLGRNARAQDRSTVDTG